ncbi:hypothetical protein NLU13_8381 [Sarocladium strictum]|uniref:Uncharacterized protein n=1 Tax=Sarocladium strictum TaxID=5046 RepID=A0AA39GBJ6_SARSR|nr:hypothetical protein NLU13_8381 [Sarocladium strictum]
MPPHHQGENVLGHITGVVHKTHTQAQEFQAQAIARFNEMDESLAKLSDHLEIISQQLHTDRLKIQENHDHMETKLSSIQDGLQNFTERLTGQVRPAIISSVNVVRDAVNAVRNRVEDLEQHVVQPVRDAVAQTQGTILGRIGELQGVVLAGVNTQLSLVVTNSEERIQDAIGTRLQGVVNSHNTALDVAKDAIIDAVKGPRSDIEELRCVCGDIKQHTEGIQNIETTCASINTTCESINTTCESINTTCESINTTCESISTTCESISTTCTEIREVDCPNIVKDIRDARTEMRVGHANQAARLFNKSTSCCNTGIATFRGIDNKRIHGFPTTYSDWSNIGGRIDEILIALGLRTTGDFDVKKQRLKIYLGLRK